MSVSDEAVEAATVEIVKAVERNGLTDVFAVIDIARRALESAAPYMLADILEDAANTAETDELTTAAEVIYDLRRHAEDLRPPTPANGR